MNIRTMMRCGDVTRFHIVRTYREQTIAEHMYKTWIIAKWLMNRIYPEWLPTSEKYQLTEYWALVHDLPECVIGDMPTPVKRYAEKKVGDRWFWRELESETLNGYSALLKKVQATPVAYLVKLADLVESYAFLDAEAVSSHGHDVKAGIADRIQAVARDADTFWKRSPGWLNTVNNLIHKLETMEIEHYGKD